MTELPKHPSFASRKFAAAISQLPEDKRIDLRDRFEAHCESFKTWEREGYDHKAEESAYDLFRHHLPKVQ